jgi:tetratricopeptide (TPR) repeat protein
MQEIGRLLKRLETEPDNVDIFFDLADAYGREKNQTEAISVMTRLLQKELSLEEWGDAKRWLGFLYYGENDFCAAIEIAKELLEANIDAYNTGQAHHLMGLCLRGKSHYAERTALGEQYRVEAVQHLKQAIELIETEGEDRAEILMVWGTELRLQNRFDEAADVLNSALGMAPAESTIAGMCHEKLGLVYFEGPKEYEKVVLHLEEAVKILLNNDPNYPLTWVYANLSQAYVRLQQYDKALTNAQRSLEAVNQDEEDWKSKLANAHQACGDVYYYSELDLSLAQKHYRACLKLLNEEELTERAQTMAKLANIERMKGKHKRALKGYKEVLALNAPGIDYGVLYAAIRECSARTKNFKAAVEAYKSSIAHSGDDEEAVANGYLYLGHSLFELKRYEEAAEAYREGLKYVDPKAPERAEMMEYLVAANELRGR